jgi:hypothetical protein
MITRGLLDQLLKSGTEMLQGGSSSQGGSQSGNTHRQSSGKGASSLSGLLTGVGGGALGAGAIGMLLGSKKSRTRPTTIGSSKMATSNARSSHKPSIACRPRKRKSIAMRFCAR